MKSTKFASALYALALVLVPATLIAQQVKPVAVDTSTAAESAQQEGAAARQQQQQQQGAPLPEAVEEVERDIEREVRRWHVGVRAGVAVDPELIIFGVQSRIGPIFNRNVFFRPNVEFGFGEVTELMALNPEVVYRLPFTTRQARWSAYFGAGPAFTFLHQNFERRQGTPREIDFGDFDLDTGFNLLGGVQFRRGTFLELKSSVYSQPAPSVRLIVGYNF